MKQRKNASGELLTSAAIILSQHTFFFNSDFFRRRAVLCCLCKGGFGSGILTLVWDDCWVSLGCVLKFSFDWLTVFWVSASLCLASILMVESLTAVCWAKLSLDVWVSTFNQGYKCSIKRSSHRYGLHSVHELHHLHLPTLKLNPGLMQCSHRCQW